MTAREGNHPRRRRQNIGRTRRFDPLQTAIHGASTPQTLCYAVTRQTRALPNDVGGCVEIGGNDEGVGDKPAS